MGAATTTEAYTVEHRISCNAADVYKEDKKLVGAAWTEVGKEYAGDPAAAEQLALKIKKGTKGNWGAITMSPNATVKKADIKAMVEFILSLK